MKLQRLIKLALLAICLLSIISSAAAQSTIFNVPSSDVQAPRKVYLEADFITHFASYANGGYQTYGPRVVVGLPGNTEVGVNVFYTRSSGPEPVNLQPNFKWQFYQNEKRGLAFAAGVLVSIPVTHRRDGKTTGLVYIVGSKNFEGAHGPRLTFGGYQRVGRFDDGTDKTGVLAGYEQPLTKKLSFVTDWVSGNNDLGYVTSGAGITFSPKNNIYAGYSFGNHGRGNNSFSVYYGHTF
ncbi:MAG: hypothetical protein ABJA18_10170 [bacterium]